MSQSGIIPARKSVSVLVRKGESIKIINTYGKQVVDFWAFNPNDAFDYLSMVHCRTVLSKISLSVNDTLVSSKRKPMVTLIEDTTPGVHDMLWSACDSERYRMLGAQGWHDNCSHNLHTTLKTDHPAIAIPDAWTPDPLNLFMNVPVNQRGGLDTQAPVSEKGQYVVFKAEVDVVIVMSACPQDMAPVNAGMPMDCEYQVLSTAAGSTSDTATSIPMQLSKKGGRRVKVALSFDFDAVSHWLGTGCHPDNNMADYSSGIFSGRVGSIRLLGVLEKLQIADKVTWFIPGHTMETFPESVKKVVASGAEVGLHGYSHEGIYQMTLDQERDVLDKCIEVCTQITGKKPRGYRAPMYTIRETTVELLRERNFLYDTSMNHHDSQPYWTPNDPPIKTIDFSQPASSWLHPTVLASDHEAYPQQGVHPLVEVPCGWYNEDMMPLQYLPHTPNSHGYVATRVIEQMWKDKFTWLWENSNEDFVFPILMHPDTSGMAHIIGMSERIMTWLKGWGDQVKFCTHEEIARDWLSAQQQKARL
ncbi:glycoside hydrolase/deacetylase [Rhizodiscina lignyota]|uniref:Glycoside hydrolase/deacetylase n=1 Tax=Rhizodiscina lignyota TaxID=1504668 RepID=A0A9P4M626_9PEZI|nr:glycoside hydrolase/deacetylase [Rhizodiscina lignyota]